MDKYIELVKQAIECYIKNKTVISVPKNLPDEFYSKKAGVFVTIKNNKELRGCIGTYLATKKKYCGRNYQQCYLSLLARYALPCYNRKRIA